MPNRLIIVESPSKARTLARFLGSEYTVLASMGHVRDLPKSKIGVDVDNDFLPVYEVIKGKEKQIKELKAAARKAEATLLAADPDREGEAIAWHLTQALGLRDPDRIVFHEITRGAVEAALASPRKIDRSLVAAQEARRVIDRLVGYRLSPLLWRKVRAGLSAGRVQSVAVRLVVDREAEIDAFVPVESWTIDAVVVKEGSNPFKARLIGRRGDAGDSESREKMELGVKTEADAVLRNLGIDSDGHPTASTPPFVVRSVETRETSRQAPQPYTTSTLQQDASTRLRMPPKRTMSIAQQLYEGVDLGTAGSTGLITYMRTDSTRISDLARDEARRYIASSLGDEYVRRGTERRKEKAPAPVNIQDAHEAIRPTDVSRTPESIQAHLQAPQLRLYELIWRRFVSSQMSPARYLNTRATVDAGDYEFRATGSRVIFDGFQRVWRRDEEKDGEETLPALADGDPLQCLEVLSEQHFTQPPPRYSEASLIKELEERGIGRPSTYAPILETIQERNYVRQEERRLHPTELGKTVDTVLRANFPEIVDVTFTAELEKRLDRVEEGRREYVRTVREWYEPFAKTVARAESTMQRVKVPARETGETCPECEIGQLVVREGRFGEFVGCSRFPACTYIKDRRSSEPEPTGESCPQCGRPLVQRRGRRGPFVGCSGYPECTYIKNERGGARTPASPPEPTGEMCPECGKPLVNRRGRYGPFVSCSGYPQCKYRPPRVSARASADGAPTPQPAATAEPV
jgi:DNA topoisomerase I